jgi:hypothetical protein
VRWEENGEWGKGEGEGGGGNLREREDRKWAKQCLQERWGVRRGKEGG